MLRVKYRIMKARPVATRYMIAYTIDTFLCKYSGTQKENTNGYSPNSSLAHKHYPEENRFLVAFRKRLLIVTTRWLPLGEG